MTVCNMSIEGGARAGYVNPDETTFAYLRGRAVRAPGRRVRARASPGGAAIASDRDARYDDRVEIAGGEIAARPSPGASTPARRAAWTSRMPRARRRRRTTSAPRSTRRSPT